ncbi:MAG: hypothetical protein IKD04_02270 [Clostridia bacterium]|nr:hypothetical protein [Clostridia bacterium]
MSIADKLLTIADNTPAVCETVKSAVTTISGEIITLADVCNTEHELSINLTSDTVTDFSGITVSRYGKNLLNVNNREVVSINYSYNTEAREFNGNKLFLSMSSNNYINALNLISYSIGKQIKLLSQSQPYGLGFDVKVKPNTTYICSCNTSNGEISIGLYNQNGEYLRNIYLQSSVISFATKDNECWANIVLKAKTDNVEATISDVQLEIADTATEYEAYKEPQTATANADGTVEGLTSLSPNMTLISDTDGISAECRYRTEANQEKWDKFAELQSGFEAAKQIIQSYL